MLSAYGTLPQPFCGGYPITQEVCPSLMAPNYMQVSPISWYSEAGLPGYTLPELQGASLGGSALGVDARLQAMRQSRINAQHYPVWGYPNW
jgi:hypothetical protein